MTSRFSRATDRPEKSAAGDYPPGLVELVQGLGQTLEEIRDAPKTGEGVPLRGARYIPLAPAISSTATEARPVSSPCKLLGWSFLETAGANILVQLYDGDTNHILGGIDLTANASSTQWFGDKGIAVLHAIRVGFVSGNGLVAGSVFVSDS